MPSPAIPAVRAVPAVPAVSVPTRLRLPDLLHITDRFADEVLSGRFTEQLPPGGLPADARWFTRLHADDELDVWLISWKPGLTTELHDHGGSLGALTVISGELNEHRWDGHRMRSRRLAAGDQAAFPLGWVHDVAGDALSVHAYSPPLTVMSYYAVSDRKRLHRTRTELTGHAPAEPGL